jgi:hypothetical protein
MVTLLVHLWVPDESQGSGDSASTPVLRGVVSDGTQHSPRPFSGPDQLVLQLQEALADRLRDERALPT